jgi:hypothetical protein
MARYLRTMGASLTCSGAAFFEAPSCAGIPELLVRLGEPEEVVCARPRAARTVAELLRRRLVIAHVRPDRRHPGTGFAACLPIKQLDLETITRPGN